jgi:hypothetical protein
MARPMITIFNLRHLTPERPMPHSARKPWKFLAAGLGMLALAGCAAPAAYAPRQPGQSTGYTDRELAPNRYRVTFTGNSATSREQVEDDLLLRAAEVTLAAGYSHFLFDTRDTKANVRYDAFPEPRPRPFGGFGYWSFRPRWGYDPFGPEVDIMTTTRYEAYAEIVLLKDADAAREPRAVDARAVIAHVSPTRAAPPV